METVDKQIEQLYENFLARLKFFRKFISTLKIICSFFLDLKEEVIKLQVSNNDKDLKIKELEKSLFDLEERVDSWTKKQSPLTYTAASQIMDKHYENYNK